MAIPNNTITAVHVGEAIDEFRAGMRAEDFPHLASILTNLYSDPISAVIREYSTNALDSHIDAGVSEPIRVYLPTEGRLEFSVQDFGVGLSVDDLRNVYSMYGYSTKRGSNTVVGQLGLGCKSGLTYADAFTIVSVKNGIKTIALSTKDEHGVGIIKVLDTASTSEPNGVRITIPVDRWDVGAFKRSAESLFQFWERGTVLVDDVEPDEPEWRRVALELDPHTFVVPYNFGLNSSYVVMGNVAYAVEDVSDIKNRTRRRFVAYLNMGDVDFVPSREAVHHTPHTDATLDGLQSYILDNFQRVLDRNLDSAGNNWESTKIKTLWNNSSVTVRASGDRVIWTFTPNVYGKQAYSSTVLSLSNLTRESTAVITGFTARNLSPQARERLLTFLPDTSLFAIFPEGANGVSQLSGRPNVFHWDDVVAATGDVTKSAGPRAKKQRNETRYVTSIGDKTAAELASLDTKVVYLTPEVRVTHGSFGAVLVYLRSHNQVNRLRRLVPNVVSYAEEVGRQVEAVKEAITPLDRKRAKALTFSRELTRLDPSRIDDPEMAEMIRLANSPKSVEHEMALKFGISLLDTSDMVWVKQLTNRYPLVVGNRYATGERCDADIVLYMNAKYASLLATLESDENAA